MILCFDVGGTAIKIAHARSAEEILPQGRIPTPGRDYPAFIQALQAVIQAAPEPPTGLAFSLAGVLDPDTGRANVANIPCLSGRRLGTELQAELGLPVVLANDADCFALAEATVGAGRGHEVVFGIILGTGIGGGIVVRGDLINARGGFAGEWGHGPVAQRILGDVTLPAFPCGCGQTGCLDPVCSARGMERLHAHLHDETPDSLAIVAAWEKGERRASQTIALWLGLLSGPLAMIGNLLGADIMAAGGGLSNSRALVAALDAATRPKMLRRFNRPLIVPAGCAIEPGLVGAAVLGLRHLPRPGDTSYSNV